jgi:flagellar motor protein MotB
MEINPHLIIEIAGHVNVPNQPPISKENPSWDLSLRRAKMVYDYLIEEGIPAEQLSYKPYGNHEMRFPDARSEIKQAANRRVEIRVIGTLPNEH